MMANGRIHIVNGQQLCDQQYIEKVIAEVRRIAFKAGYEQAKRDFNVESRSPFAPSP